MLPQTAAEPLEGNAKYEKVRTIGVGQRSAVQAARNKVLLLQLVPHPELTQPGSTPRQHAKHRLSAQTAAPSQVTGELVAIKFIPRGKHSPLQIASAAGGPVSVACGVHTCVLPA